ncbi:MAG: HAMP domain-containing protein [Cytophagales bacterium]|nr:MAG: HAMP domain-containing protein [Cytophagales bacterium]
MIKINLQNSISSRIISGYGIIIFLGIITTVICVYNINKNKNIDREITEVIFPLSLALKDYSSISIESNRLINNWVYQPNKKEKTQLVNLVEKEYPIFQKKLNEITLNIDSDSLTKSINELNIIFNKIVSEQKNIIQKLQADSSYSNDIIVDDAIQSLETGILPSFVNFNQQIITTEFLQRKLLDEKKENKNSLTNWISIVFIGTLSLFLLIAITFSYYSINTILKPIQSLKQKLDYLAKGRFVEINIATSKDEIGTMTNSLSLLVKGLKAKAEFAEQIGDGNYESNIELLSDEDTLGEEIIKMKNNLKIASQNEQNRNWSNIGIAQIADILRSDFKSENLYPQIISFIVKYIGANQGGLFILNESENEEKKLLLKACYAYDRKKYLEKEILPGEGLVGQCYIEKQAIYLTDVPDEYINITSGLGSRNPNCILIVPLKINDIVHGIIEVASFDILEKYKLEFLEKISENIASGIASIINNEKTYLLLKESQEQAEILRSQEEEMKQNIEELSATQEEMSRKEKQLQSLLDEAQKKEETMTLMAYNHKEEVERIKAEVELLQLKLKRKNKQIEELSEKN